MAAPLTAPASLRAPAQLTAPAQPPAGGWPRISLVTPSFNQGWALERTIRSVLDQGYPDLEHIIMDGGSTDDSVAVIRRHETRLAHWQSAPDGGQTAAIVAGLAHATGPVLGYLNSDDVLAPGSLHSIGRALADGHGWAVGWTRIIDQHDRVLVSRPTLPVALQDVVRHRYILPQEATFFTRGIYERSGGFDPAYHYAMDAHLWMRLLSLEAPRWVPAYIGGFRVHDQQKTSRMDLYWAEFAKAADGLPAWRAARGLPPLPPPTGRRRFALAKVLHYLRHTGPLNMWRVHRFRQEYRADG